MTADQAPELAKFLANRLDVDYFTTLQRLREKGSRFEYIARRVPSTLATDVVERGRGGRLRGPRHPAATRSATTRPATSPPTWSASWAPTRRSAASSAPSTPSCPAPTARPATRSAAATGSRWGRARSRRAVDGQDLRTTIDQDLQWYTQRVLRQTVEDARGDSGFAVVMDSRTGEILALADHPTFDANHPLAVARGGPRVARDERRLRARLGREGAHAERAHRRRQGHRRGPGSRCPASLARAGPGHPRLVPARPDPADPRRRRSRKSSNIGTVLAADKFDQRRAAVATSRSSASARRTDIGVRGETPGILPDPSIWTRQTQDRIAFGQSLSVNAVQMAAAVNTHRQRRRAGRRRA